VINHHFLLGQAGLLQFRIIPSIDTALGQWHFSGMATDHLPASSELLNQRLAEKGLRATSQRQHVYGVLLGQRDHPSAEEVFMRAKQSKPEISMATVYNSLDALVKCGVVRQVNVDRGATLFCSNMGEHAHFCCDDCGKVFDMNLKDLPCVPEVDVPGEFGVRKIGVRPYSF
jgi:Fur family peroxide stress response transcriptional regulator